MPEINILDKHVAELIAAGEVVERPASVVKELMENSIDAGATLITVEIRRGGITYIRITDNGCGIDRSNIRKAFISHATSKISSADDLDSILTLGFRGEALASVSAVARVEMLTRAENEEIGTRYCIEGSQETLLDDAGCPKGTTIVVRDLFFNTPARMKFLKKDVTEANSVAGVVDRIALSHPEVCVRFIREGKEVLATPGDGNIKNTVHAIFDKDFSQGLIQCEYELNGIKVNGFISKPVHARANRTMQFFFLNGRLIKTRTAMAALEQAYKNAIMVGKFPACVLNISIPPMAVDVNVHPAKTEVRFADEKKIFDAVYYCAKLALESGDTRPQMSFEAKTQLKVVSQTMPQPPKAEQTFIRLNADPASDDAIKKVLKAEAQFKSIRSTEKIQPDDRKSSLEALHKSFVKNVMKVESGEKPNQNIQSDDDLLLNNPTVSEVVITEDTVKLPLIVETPIENKKEQDDLIITETLTPPKTEPEIEPISYIEPFKVIGEAFKTYILVEQGDKMLVIDKHAAHERMIFDSLKKEQDGVQSQMLLTPVTITLSKEEYNAVLENTDILLKAGYAVEDFGQGMVIVTECPTFIESGDIEPVVIELAGYLADNKKDLIPEKLDWIYHSTACRAAIKAGDKTTPYEQQKFVEQLFSLPDVRYCPHGRPVMIEMSKKELEKNFGRI
ncbi:MAG: DNA mismatch repair endonuclease MutL [Clostridia bacterium]|nr:DNA mismatch repair endonuclease MutL [Clostridia bacterium]